MIWGLSGITLLREMTTALIWSLLQGCRWIVLYRSKFLFLLPVTVSGLNISFDNNLVFSNLYSLIPFYFFWQFSQFFPRKTFYYITISIHTITLTLSNHFSRDIGSVGLLLVYFLSYCGQQFYQIVYSCITCVSIHTASNISAFAACCPTTKPLECILDFIARPYFLVPKSLF